MGVSIPIAGNQVEKVVLKEVHDAKMSTVLSNDSNMNIIVCEAVNCYKVATETIIVSAGKFGTLTLNLCHVCAVKKFGSQEN
jgi:hypothetical protein